MYVSIRTYRVGTGSIDELMHRVDRDLADALFKKPAHRLPGRPYGNRAVASITMFHELEQAERSNELAVRLSGSSWNFNGDLRG